MLNNHKRLFEGITDTSSFLRAILKCTTLSYVLAGKKKNPYGFSIRASACSYNCSALQIYGAFFNLQNFLLFFLPKNKIVGWVVALNFKPFFIFPIYAIFFASFFGCSRCLLRFVYFIYFYSIVFFLVFRISSK